MNKCTRVCVDARRACVYLQYSMPHTSINRTIPHLKDMTLKWKKIRYKNARLVSVSSGTSRATIHTYCTGTSSGGNSFRKEGGGHNRDN